MAQFFHHPYGVAETAGIVSRFRGTFAFSGPQNTVHQTGEVGLVECATRFHRFVQNSVSSLLAETELEKRDQHQVVNNAILSFNRFLDRKSTRLNSSHVRISYAVFCL